MMWLFKLSCIAMLLPTLCKEKMKGVRSTREVKLNITTLFNTLNQTANTLPLVIEITNTSGSAVSILNFPDFATDSLSIFQLVIEKNGKKKISPAGYLKKRRKPQAGDYRKLKVGETLFYRFDLDMRLLVDDTKHFGKENNDYGSYKILVIFNDHFLIKKKAIDHLESNIVEIEYVL